MRLLLAASILSLCCVVSLGAGAPSLRGRIVDPSGLPLPGVTVTLHGGAGNPIVVVTDTDGQYSTPVPEPGRYDIDAALPAFTTAIRNGVELTTDAAVLDLELALAVVEQDVTVRADAPLDMVSSTQPDAPVSVTRTVMDVAMLPNSQVDDVLPLMPNVLRGPDGAIAVAGARSTSSALFVNGLDATDPIVGGSGLMLPIEAVDAMQVYAGGAPAEFGHATGGVTAVRTRAGTDHFHMSLDSFVPRLLYTNQGLGGIAFWDPNLGISGPLGSKVTYQQALSYRYDRNAFTTLQGPDHNVFAALLSWTEVDAALANAGRLRLFLGADPRNTDRANITAFSPGSSAPRVTQGGWQGGAATTMTARGLLLDLHASVQENRAVVEPPGNSSYVLSHTLASGSYFDHQDRRASRLEGGARLMWSPSGHQTITVGATVARATLDQQVDSTPITMLASDQTVVRTVTFLSTGAARTGATIVGLFAQDQWAARPWLTLNAGLRYDETTTAGDTPLSPRVGWTLGRSDGHTTLSGGAGLASDALPRVADAFAGLPARTISTFDAQGLQTSTTTLTNVVDPQLRVPQALLWDLEVNRRLAGWSLRARYSERHGSRELVVVPPVDSDIHAGASTTMLASSGTSRARSLETTVGYHAASGAEWYVSYVRAESFGASNSLDVTEGLLRVPFVQPNLEGPLPIDVPHRLLTWGVFRFPSNITVAPFVEARSGFPYTAIDDTWAMQGTPGMYRLPATASLDLSVTRVTHLPRHLPDARVGIKLYNIASVHTEREVQRDLARPDFGTRYDPVPRDFSFVFEFLWGRHPG